MFFLPAVLLVGVGLAAMFMFPHLTSPGILFAAAFALGICALVLKFVLDRFHFGSGVLRLTAVCLVGGVAVMVLGQVKWTLNFRSAAERFLRDRRIVVQTIDQCLSRPYNGLVDAFPRSGHSSAEFPGEDFIRGYLDSGRWSSDGRYQAIYRPDPAKTSTKPEVNAAEVFDFYFSRLEASGFTSGTHGSTYSFNIGSMQSASRSWFNRDRSLHVVGEVITDKRSGETVIIVSVTANLSRGLRG